MALHRRDPLTPKEHEPAVTLYIEVHNRRPVEEKRALARLMTDACAEALGVTGNDVHIRFSINTYQNIVRAGALLSDIYPATDCVTVDWGRKEALMMCPEPTVTLYADINDKRTVEQKRALAGVLVDACCQALDLTPKHVAVRFRVFSYQNMARGGVLLSDIEGG